MVERAKSVTLEPSVETDSAHHRRLNSGDGNPRDSGPSLTRPP